MFLFAISFGKIV